jgi:hypothetical protein
MARDFESSAPRCALRLHELQQPEGPRSRNERVTTERRDERKMLFSRYISRSCLNRRPGRSSPTCRSRDNRRLTGANRRRRPRVGRPRSAALKHHEICCAARSSRVSGHRGSPPGRLRAHHVDKRSVCRGGYVHRGGQRAASDSRRGVLHDYTPVRHFSRLAGRRTTFERFFRAGGRPGQ